jgi:hypothetical protein
MRVFNTPFFPDILVCSEVMGEGVDLQRFCRHVVHHDLAWNPSNIEQRTGRIDRLGCKAEGNQPILIYLPYLAGTADERQYNVMSYREQWFRVVMGQDEVSRLITPDISTSFPLPDSLCQELSFTLSLDSSWGHGYRSNADYFIVRDEFATGDPIIIVCVMLKQSSQYTCLPFVTQHTETLALSPDASHRPPYTRRGDVMLQLHLPGQESPVIIERAAVRWVGGNDFGLQFLSLHSVERERLRGLLQWVA